MNLIDRLTAEEIAALAGEDLDASARAHEQLAAPQGNLVNRRGPELASRRSPATRRLADPAEDHGSRRPASIATALPRTPLSTELAKLVRGACERLARQVSAAWSQLARTPVDVRWLDLETLDLRSFVFPVDSSCGLAALRAEQFEATLALELPPPVLFPLLAGLLGAPQGLGDERSSNRTPTDLERRLASRYVRSWAQECRPAWRDLGPLDAHFDRWELRPQRAWLAAPSDEYLVARYRVAMAEQSGEIRFAIPCGLLDAFDEFRERAQAARTRGAVSDSNSVARSADSATDLTLEVCLADISLSLADLRSMQVGDIVATDHAIDAPLIVRRHDEIVGSGEPGTVSGRRAIRLLSSHGP